MIDVVGPEPHRVYPRGESGTADIPYQLRFPMRGAGEVQISIASPDDYSKWQTIAAIEDNDRYEGVVRGLQTGLHRIKFRLTGGTAEAEPDSVTVVDPIFVGDLWVLAGQSNMKGFGKLNRTESPQLGLSCFYLDERWDVAEDPLCWLNESTDPVHWTVSAEQRLAAASEERRDRTQGAGLALAFAKEVFRVTGVPIGLIPCAKGATSIEDWSPDQLDEQAKGNSLYGAMLRRIERLGGSIRGCLWYQGESDANEADAPRYRERMRRWIERLRMDLSNPELPVIYAQLSVHYADADADAKWWNQVQHEQYLLERELEQVAVVPTIDASLSDIIHLDAVSLRDVGLRMAWQAIKLAYRGELKLVAGPRPADKNGGLVWNEERTMLELKLDGVNGEITIIGTAATMGFHIEHGDQKVPFAAALSPNNQSILFRFEQPVPPAAQLWHGRGFNPLVQIVDRRNIPLLVFGPITI